MNCELKALIYFESLKHFIKRKVNSIHSPLIYVYCTFVKVLGQYMNCQLVQLK